MGDKNTKKPIKSLLQEHREFWKEYDLAGWFWFQNSAYPIFIPKH